MKVSFKGRFKGKRIHLNQRKINIVVGHFKKETTKRGKIANFRKLELKGELGERQK